MLIDQYLPRYDVTEVREVTVDATPEVTYHAIRETDLTDPMIDALFAIRELLTRLAGRLRGEVPPPAPATFTFNDLATPAMGFILLAEEPGVEFVVASVGRFWRRDYGWHPVAPDQFVGFTEPGYAKLAISFLVKPTGDARALLRYEARTVTTDEVARKRFRRYWRVIRPGVALVMRRALIRIRAEAERRQAALIGAT
jgi:hypothetical protein